MKKVFSRSKIFFAALSFFILPFLFSSDVSSEPIFTCASVRGTCMEASKCAVPPNSLFGGTECDKSGTTMTCCSAPKSAPTTAPTAPTCISQGKECLLEAACEPGSIVPAGDCFSYQKCCTPGVVSGIPPPPTPTITCVGSCDPGSCQSGTVPASGTCGIGESCCAPAPASATLPSTTPPPTTGASSGSTADSGGSGLVPCGYQEGLEAAENCQFQHFLILAKNVINFLLFTIAVPIAAISFAWAGWLYLSAAGNESKVQEAHRIFGYVVLGLCIALAAWLIVNAIIVGLGLFPKYNPLTGGTFGG